MKNRILWVIAAMATAGVAAADGYRWVDDEGNVVFSQTPPPGNQAAERIQLPSSQHYPETETSTETTAAPDMETQESAEKPATVQDMDPAVRKEYCDKAKKNVELLEKTQPGVPFITEDNNVVRFTEEEKAERLQQAQEAAEVYCGPEGASE
jgi:hypothetical protein